MRPARRARSAVLASIAATAVAALALGPVAAASADPGPLLSASVTSIDFGAIPVGQVSGVQKVTFTNVGTADLHLTQASWPSAPFGVPTTDCSAPLAPGGSCFADVTFSPTGAGAFSDVLMINSDGGLVEVALSGDAPGAPIGPQLTVAPGHDFGSTSIGQASASFDFTVKNEGDAAVTDLVISGSSSAAFSRSTNCTATLAPGASCTVTAAFAPMALGGALGSIEVTAYGNQWAIGLLGVGVAGLAGPAADPSVPSLATTGDPVAPSILVGLALLALGAMALLGRRARVTRRPGRADT